METAYKSEIKPTYTNWVPSDGRGLVSTPCNVLKRWHSYETSRGFHLAHTWRGFPRKCGAGRCQSQQQLPKAAPPFLLQTLPKLSGLAKGGVMDSCSHLVSSFFRVFPRHISIRTTSTINIWWETKTSFW